MSGHFLLVCPYRHVVFEVRPEPGERLFSVCSRAFGGSLMDIKLLQLPARQPHHLTKLTIITDPEAMNAGARPWGVIGVGRPFFGKAIIAGSDPTQPETTYCPWPADEFRGWITWVGLRSEVH